MERQDPDSEVNDSKMTERFDQIKNTEKDNETRLNRLLRTLCKKKINIIKKQVDDYLDRTYQDKYNEEE